MQRSTRSSTAAALMTTKRTTPKAQPPSLKKRLSETSRASDKATSARKRTKTEREVKQSGPDDNPSHASLDVSGTPSDRNNDGSKGNLSDTKWKAWSKDAHASPFPEFGRPTERECRQSHRILEKMHAETVRKNFEYTDNPEMHYPYVMDALIVATLSQATSWSNAQRAMKSMTEVYGSPFEYQAILDGGEEKLVAALRPGGMQNRKGKMVMQILVDVKERHGRWDLNHLFDVSDDDAVKELLTYKGVGPKSAFCILSICLQRNSFAVDTHIYRIAGLWGWIPKTATREKAQAHLDAMVPNDIKFSMHYLLIVHGRECPVCKGNGNPKATCEYKTRMKDVGDEIG